ncbi:MAG: hypothetical protein Q9168_006046 [Polycauliona sp. 1 TL-2023]
MAILDGVLQASAQSISLREVSLLVVFVVAVRCVYRVLFHPLRHVPGPIIPKCTNLWLYYHSFVGDQCTVIQTLHQRYGPVLRVGPNDVDISKGEALWPIYGKDGGFQKSSSYENFNVDGHKSIFSTTSLAVRGPRAKAVRPIFSAAAVREATGMLSSSAEAITERMKGEALSHTPVNVLNLTRSYALDAVCSYVFQHPYNAVEEKSVHLSASPSIDLWVTAGRYFYLPLSWFLPLVWTLDQSNRNRATLQSVDVVRRFLEGMVENAKEAGHGYPNRLLSSGTPIDETVAQCKDIFLGGADTVGNSLAYIYWALAANPDVYSRLRKEVQDNAASQADIQTLPYLTGVVKEGLRLSYGLAIRLPRVVPKQGWTFDGYYLPKGTNVGISAFQLHRNAKVFPEPQKFLPERWSEATAEMNRDWVPFGTGARSCIARNLALTELFIATEKVAASDVLRGAKTTVDQLDIYEWFNSRVRGDRIEIVWPEVGA